MMKNNVVMIGVFAILLGFSTVDAFGITNEAFFEFTDRLFIHYIFENGDVNSVEIDSDTKSMLVEIVSYGNGVLELEFPKDMLDTDDEFSIFVDTVQVNYDESCCVDNLRSVTIEIPQGTTTVEIIGSEVASELAESKIPDWVRNIFIWYANEQISEDELLGALQFLIQQEIILV